MRETMLMETERIRDSFQKSYEKLPEEIKKNRKAKILNDSVRKLASLIKEMAEVDEGVSTLLFGVLAAMASGPEAVDLLINIQCDGIVDHVTNKILGTPKEKKGYKREEVNLYDSVDAKDPVDIRRL